MLQSPGNAQVNLHLPAGARTHKHSELPFGVTEVFIHLEPG